MGMSLAPWHYEALALVLLAFPGYQLWRVSRRGRAAAILNRAWAAQLSGNPRRARALTKLLARWCPPELVPALRVCEANALLWEGSFTRAIELLDAHLLPARPPTLGAAPLVIKLESLVFDGRFDEAQTLFDAHAGELRAAQDGAADVIAIEGFLAFHRNDLATAETRIEEAIARTTPVDPIVSGAHFFLAAIAHRRGQRDQTRRLLTQTIREGGARFPSRWAQHEYADAFPGELVPACPPSTPRPQKERPLRHLMADLQLGVGLLFFRTHALQARSFTRQRLALLVLFNVCIGLVLHGIDYELGATVYGTGALAVIAPVLLVAPSAEVAPRRGTSEASRLRLLCGLYAALPLLLVLSFTVVRLRRGNELVPLGAELLLGAWSLAVFSGLLRTLSPRVGLLRWVAGATILIATLLVPMHIAARTRMFYPPVVASTESEDERLEMNEELNELAFMQAERLQTVESSVSAERPGIVDLYFVGAAGWADQDVFLREVRSARTLFDDRFGTAGRSLLLANDPSSRDELPVAANVTLRHALKTVGARMNRDEDVLFFFLTSHGSQRGIALEFGPRTGFRSEVLKPADLRSMLDEAGIKWRVLVISGCESGVFVAPLMDDYTLVATAASDDRPSYGCASGNAFTEFGRVLFAEELTRERSFIAAFVSATATVGQREVEAGVLTSRPQLAQGSKIAGKLRELEEPLATGSASTAPGSTPTTDSPTAAPRSSPPAQP